jgi:flavin reductase
LAVDTGRYRTAMSRLATGVTVVTTHADGRHELMTANAVMSVSLQPTLLVVSVAETTRWLRAVLDRGRFVVNVLGHEHVDLARWCADHARHGRPDHVLDHDASLSPEGLLVLPGALAAIDCRVYDHHRAGDHRLIVGEVDRVDVRNDAGEPLVFFDHSFTTTRAVAPMLRHVAAS